MVNEHHIVEEHVPEKRLTDFQMIPLKSAMINVSPQKDKNGVEADYVTC